MNEKAGNKDPHVETEMVTDRKNLVKQAIIWKFFHAQTNQTRPKICIIVWVPIRIFRHHESRQQIISLVKIAFGEFTSCVNDAVGEISNHFNRFTCM